MIKEKSPRRKGSLVSILSLGSLVLGLGCIFWSLVNIGAQSLHTVDVYCSPSSGPTTFGVKQGGLMGDDAASTEPDRRTDMPSDMPTDMPTDMPSDMPADMPSDMPSDMPTDTCNPDKILYPLYPEEGEEIGSLLIPDLKQKLPIIQGTGADELKKGVGHFIQSALPGEEDNCVLSGHRDTVFSKLGKLEIGDQLIVETSAGVFTYEVKKIRIVGKDDKTVIIPADHAVLTLSTCYPFLFVGKAPDRYIITADLVISDIPTSTD